MLCMCFCIHISEVLWNVWTFSVSTRGRESWWEPNKMLWFTLLHIPLVPGAQASGPSRETLYRNFKTLFKIHQIDLFYIKIAEYNATINEIPRNLCNCEIVNRQKHKYFSEKFAIFVINYKIDHYGIIIAAALCIKKQYRMTKIQTGNWDFEGWE